MRPSHMSQPHSPPAGPCPPTLVSIGKSQPEKPEAATLAGPPETGVSSIEAEVVWAPGTAAAVEGGLLPPLLTTCTCIGWVDALQAAHRSRVGSVPHKNVHCTV
eukprot:scaffold1038_cov21-Tisochrysis_lutea.AAC.9